MRAATSLLILLMCISLPARSRQTSDKALTKTEIISASAASQLLGRHKFQLHWISWNRWQDFADLRVVNRKGTFVIEARQQKGDDYVRILGTVLSVAEKEFIFQGTIVTRISYKNDGNPCQRDGTMTFKIVGKRRYWRLQEMQSPCDETTDYVDIFLR